ncbi:MAG: hypothetical protein M3Q29_02550 [Chloroflexota bacterium]|nr:hypothetical protein [Chloroflexota bacterium]
MSRDVLAKRAEKALRGLFRESFRRMDEEQLLAFATWCEWLQGQIRDKHPGGLGAQKVGLVGTVGTKLNYGAAVEYGRKPGKRPPTAALKGWARRKTGDERNAYRIAKRIGERGTSPQPYLEPALEARRGEIQRMFERELGNVLKRFQ